MRIFSLLFLLFVSACSSPQKINQHTGLSHDLVFPEGVYKHRVTLQLKPTNKTYTFEGMVKLSKEMTQVVVLSFFGTTELKIREDLSAHKTEVEIYREEFKKYEPKLLEYYEALRLLLRSSKKESGSLTWLKTDNQNRPLQMEALIKNELIHFGVGKYDKNGIPENMEISGAHFKVQVAVTGYEI